MPRFNLREPIMLTTICALLVPYFYSQAYTSQRIDLSWQSVTSLVKSVEPRATFHTSAGADEHVEVTCLIPAASSDAFFSNLHAAIKKQIDDSGWIIQGKSTKSTSNSLTGFSYDLSNSSTRCTVVGVLLDKKKANGELHPGAWDELRFIILSPHVR